MSKMNSVRKAAGAVFKKLPDAKQTGIIEKMVPYRTRGWVNASILTGVSAVGAIQLGIDANSSVKARNLGEFKAQSLANQVGQTPLRHSDEFIKGVPNRARQTAIGSILNTPEEGYHIQGYNDLGAGGDLVFALNNLR